MSQSGIINVSSVSIPDATEVVKGKIRLATTAEAIAGTNDTAAITPLKMAQATGTSIDELYIVAKNGSDVTGDGSLANPFLTITKAMTTITVPVDAADEKRRFIVLVMPGAYDEAVTMPAARIINLMGLGPVTLGDGAGANYSSTTPRNLTIDINDAAEKGTGRPSYTIGTYVAASGETSSTHVAYRAGFTISGDLVYNNIGVASTIETTLTGVKVQGNVDGTSAGIGGINLLIYRCFFDNLFNASTALLNVVTSTEFDGLITCASYGRLVECQIQGGMTFGNINANIPPSGIFNSQIDGGTFTSANNLKVDYVTYQSLISSGAAFAGGGSAESKELVIKYSVTDADGTAGWTGPAGGFYTRTITTVTHGQGVLPSIEVYLYDGTKSTLVIVDVLEVALNGDITIKVPDAPDLRFRARIVIS